MSNKLAAQWLPPIARRLTNRVLGTHIVYRGPFRDWASASASTDGYDQDAILKRVSCATRHVLDGSAVFEQDGVELRDTPPPAHALEGLLIAAALDSGRLSVLDFGGGLASLYLRWRHLLSALPDVHWAVVEQSNFVAEGKALFAGDPSVAFHENIADVASHPNVVLASGVLQYLAQPYAILERLIALAPRAVVLDRIPFGDTETVMTQFVPSQLGKASYPLWVLSRDKVHATLSRDYKLFNEFGTADHPLQAAGICASYCGSIWLRCA